MKEIKAPQVLKQIWQRTSILAIFAILGWKVSIPVHLWATQVPETVLPPHAFENLESSSSFKPSCGSEYRTYSPPTDTGALSTRSEWLSPPGSKRRRTSEDANYSVVSQENRPPVSTKVSSTNYIGRASPLSTSPTSFHTKHYSTSEASLLPPRETSYLPPPTRPIYPETSCQKAQGERPALPSLSKSAFAERTDQHPPWADSYTFEVPVEVSSRSIHPSSQVVYGPTMAYAQTFTYGYQQPRGHPYLSPPLQDRTPFSNGYPPPHFHEGYHHDLAHDSKQRKRRGNLPKDTTDKLRSWFVNHLNHPYPTEDEKQELMRLTGLQMNQISNWFINARRRQLPAMINSARASENAARSAQIADRSNHSGTHRERQYSLDSDEELSSYDGYDEHEGTSKFKSEFKPEPV